MSFSVPPVETERLSLRGHVRADFEDSLSMWSNPDVTRFIGGKPSTPEEVWGRLLRYVGHWSVVGYGYWVVRERATGAFVGEVGFADFRRDLTPSFEGAPEIGWALVPAHQGKGYGVEAVTAALGWGDANLPGRRTVCMIDPAHAASLRLAEKVGFRPFAQTTYKGMASVLHERIRPAS